MNAYLKATCDSTLCFISEKAVAALAGSNPSFQIHSYLSSIARVSIEI